MSEVTTTDPTASGAQESPDAAAISDQTTVAASEDAPGVTTPSGASGESGPAQAPSADSSDGGDAAASAKDTARSALRRLEEEGEVAADYLEELLDIADLDGDIDIDVENGRASVAIVAENGAARDLRRLVGSQGEVLEALQDLVRLAVQARTGERSRLMLDVAGFRASRRRAVEDIAARGCQEVNRIGEPVRLEPMTAFERKVVHDVVAEAGLVSESEGEDPHRRVVIHPAR
jgi:spoIIIJ-associated protein